MVSKKYEIKSEDIKSVSDIVGSWGPWQLRLFLTYTLVYATNPFLNHGTIFMAPRIDFWCKNDHNFRNESNFRKCVKFDNISVACTHFDYDHSFFKSTAVDEFGWVCDKAWMISASTSFFQMGYAISCLLMGHISDRFGRLFTLKLCVFCEIIAGYSQAFAVSSVHFLVSRIFLGIFGFGKFLSGYVLLVEVVSPKNRAQMTCLVEVGWYLGCVIMPLLAYFIPHFRYIQLCVTTFSLLIFGTLWFSTESPRWLVANGRLDEAEAILMSAARAKGKITPVEVREKFRSLTKAIREDVQEGKAKEKQSMMNLWRVPILLKYCLVSYALWYSCGLVSYSFTMNVGELGGNLFVNNFLYTLVGILGKVLCYFMLPRANRRRIYLISMLAGATAIFALVPTIGSEKYTTLRVVLAVTGKFFVSLGFHLNYPQATEIFPTTLRQLAVGSCSLAARFGTIAAPFSKEFNDATHPAASMVLFGSLALVAGFLDHSLPETRKTEIPDTIDEAMITYRKASLSVDYTPTEIDE